MDVANPTRRHSMFRCACGADFVARTTRVISGYTKGCGCQIGSNLLNFKKPIQHGHAKFMARSSEYNIWNAMRARCNNPNVKVFHRYGGRGISVCEAWNDFQTFITDVGARPSKAHSLDRIDNDGNYEPGNVRWALAEEQAANRSDNRWIEHEGRTLPLFLWAKETGVAASVIHKRLKRGWSFARSIGQEILM